MRDDMKMDTWAMRITVQRRLGLPLDVACQAVEAGKKNVACQAVESEAAAASAVFFGRRRTS